MVCMHGQETAVDAAGGGSALEAFEGAPPGPAEAAGDGGEVTNSVRDVCGPLTRLR